MSGTQASWWPALAVALPLLAAAAALGWSRGRARWRELTLAGAAIGTVAITVGLVAAAARERVLETFVLQLTPHLWLHLRVDAAGAAYGATAAGLGALAVVYSLDYLRDGERLGRYYGALVTCLACTVGVAFAGNLLTFLVFYELFSVLSYVLIVHEQTRTAMAAGTKYIVYILVGGSLVLAGVLLTYFAAGDLTFAPGGLFPADVPSGLLLAAFWCFVAGFGVKAALVPLHGWVPDAHPAAPAPFSAVLSGVMVAAGVFGLVRVVFEVFGADTLAALQVLPWLGWVAAITVVVGAVQALVQDDLKRRLAYSTISQMAYATLAVTLLGPLATVGALVHLTHHAFLKGTLFFCAGWFAHALGLRRVSALRGAAARAPLAAAAFALASFGMIGIPPLSGFISKWWLGVGMLGADAPWALVVLLAGALLSAGYLLPVVYALYFGRGVEPEVADTEATSAPEQLLGPRAGPVLLPVATWLAAALTLLLGLAGAVAGFPAALARQAAGAFFGGT
jgi:multicomponent Na+:H+ antiporter subunit D